MEQIYQDLAALHGQTPEWYESEMLDYYAFDWSHNGYTMGAYVYPGPGQFSALYPSIIKPAARGHLHIGGEAASKRQTWVAGALDSAWRCVYEILVQERSPKLADFLERYGTRIARIPNSRWEAPGRSYIGEVPRQIPKDGQGLSRVSQKKKRRMVALGLMYSIERRP
jgi:hypothetical protein